jgi:hypothetical protein
MARPECQALLGAVLLSRVKIEVHCVHDADASWYLYLCPLRCSKTLHDNLMQLAGQADQNLNAQQAAAPAAAPAAAAVAVPMAAAGAQQPAAGVLGR